MCLDGSSSRFRLVARRLPETALGNCVFFFFFFFFFFYLAVEAGFYSDVVECLLLDPAAQVRFPPRAVGIFLHPVTFGGQCWGPRLGFQASLRMKWPGITAWFRVDSGTNLKQGNM